MRQQGTQQLGREPAHVGFLAALGIALSTAIYVNLVRDVDAGLSKSSPCLVGSSFLIALRFASTLCGGMANISFEHCLLELHRDKAVLQDLKDGETAGGATKGKRQQEMLIRGLPHSSPSLAAHYVWHGQSLDCVHYGSYRGGHPGGGSMPPAPLRSGCGSGIVTDAATAAQSPSPPAAKSSAIRRAICGAATLVPPMVIPEPLCDPAPRTPEWTLESSLTVIASGQRGGGGGGGARVPAAEYLASNLSLRR